MQANFSTRFFYLGTFVTSFGSLLFVMCIPAIFLKIGYSSEIIGIAVGIHRFSGIAASAWFGPGIDRFNSRMVVFYTEFFAAASAIGLIASWYYRDSLGLYPFLFFIGTRALTVGVQSSSRNRLIKLLSSENQTREASFAIWLNKATQGATVLSCLAAIPLVTSGNFLLAIIIDGLSFLVGGYSALMLPDVDSTEKRNIPTNFIHSVAGLIKMHKTVFYQDQLLALAVSGTLLLMAKLSGENSLYVVYFNFLFGVCIWLSSIVAHNLPMRNRTIPYWIIMLLGYVLLSFSLDSFWRFAAYFLTYMGYWILYHKYTVEIQTKTPKEMIGAIMAARSLAIAVTLSIGELFGGYVTRLVSIKLELGIRAAVCFCVIAFLALTSLRAKKESLCI